LYWREFELLDIEMVWVSSLTLWVIVCGSTAIANGNHQPNPNSAFAALLNDAQASTGAHALSQTNMCIQCGLRNSLSMFSIQVVNLDTEHRKRAHASH